MSKLCAFKFAKSINPALWDEIIASSFSVDCSTQWSMPDRCCLQSEVYLSYQLSSLLPLWENDLNTQMVALVTHRYDALSALALDLAFNYQSGEVLNLFDVGLLALANNERGFLKDLKAYFDGITEELLYTALSFLRHNGSGTKTAAALYIHRNTLSYRLNKFQQATKLDLRDSDDAAFLRLYGSVCYFH